MDCYDFVNEYPGPADMLPDIPLVQYRHSGDTTHGGHSEFQPTLPDEPANKVEEDIVVSVSTVFGPSSKLIPTPADIVLRSSDNVFFYVHTSRLNETSENAFNALLVLRTSDILSLPEDAIVLNLVLHCIYNLSFSHYFPSLDNVLIAVNAMKKYGMPLNRYVARGTALFRQIVSQAPLQPIEVYMVAAENDLFDLAVEASSNLLAFPLFRIDDDMAARHSFYKGCYSNLLANMPLHLTAGLWNRSEWPELGLWHPPVSLVKFVQISLLQFCNLCWVLFSMTYRVDNAKKQWLNV
ncbi:unnamed protein product [Somion occarium]|uniref:BTB domain-containing protein n=1 Tax=Somion occarium TaxID=3059160 RepID=A0ABP1DLJ5_9APHY